ncbi:MAG: hypothetical protein HMLIMOIP_001335 [Candidatus Nitrosomirales archaeon]|jgi:hypothetical protein
MIVIEVLILVAAFTFLLFLTRKGVVSRSLLFGRQRAKLIASLLLVASVVIFIAPKINLLNNYEYTKLTADSWDHYLVVNSWSETDGFQTKTYPYYTKFPVTYSVQIMLHQLSGLSLFDSMTVYYLFVGIGGLLIIYGIGREIIKGSGTEKMIYAGIAGLVYSFLHYFNLLFVQQYPIAIGTVVGLLCVYSFILLVKRRKRALIYMFVAGVVLAISHPFAPIFLSLLFLTYYITNRVVPFRSNLYKGLISRRTALLMSFTILIAGMTYSMFVATGTFESGVRWSELNTQYTLQKLSSQFLESTLSGVEESFEARYGIIDSMIYPLNWALPASASISVLIFFLIRKLKVEEDEELHILFPLSIMSTLLFLLSFAFSFVEFAFSRYFGAFALALNIPVTAFLIFRIVKTRIAFAKYIVYGIVGFAIISSVTDPTFFPYIGYETSVYRDAKIYPSELDIVAWNDFYSSVSSQQKIIETDLHGAPIKYFKETHDYNNEIVVNPNTYTLTSDNAYVVIDKDKTDLTPQLQDNPLLDRVYDNSKIYFGH